MRSALIMSGVARNDADAFLKLNTWSIIVSEDFKARNLKATTSGVVGGVTFEAQVNKLNSEVARMIQAKTDMQAQLQQMNRQAEMMEHEIGLLKTTMQQMVHQNCQLLDKYQTLVDQNNRILQHFGLENQNRHGNPVGQQVTPTPRPDAAPDNRPTPPGLQAAVEGPHSPAARTGPGWAPPLPAAVVQPVMTVNQALMPARVSQGCKGQTHSGETLIGILRAW
jgi:TolA-binding protein